VLRLVSGCAVVSGRGFVGKFFTVRNTAGAAGHQAVATRVSADVVAFYKVKFDGYQDTLYCHTFRQFYRECVVAGTVDFMFGNGNAVFQSCQLVAKKTTILGQQNTYTAQGRIDPHQNTGLAFQDCNFDGTSDLKRSVASYPSFLGRPWKKYSVCVLLRPTIQAHVDRTGWLPWNTSSFGLYTSFFAEYHGKGPGSNTRYRVKWSHQITDAKTANKYQAASFINGKSWLPYIDVPYDLKSV
jgi:pectinesterase